MRTRNPILVLGPDGKPLAGAQVTTNVRATGNPATVYTAETGATLGANPDTTDANGRVTQWLERGAYSSTIVGPGLTPWVEHWDSSPASDGAIDQAWLANAIVDAARIVAGLKPSGTAGAAVEALRALGATGSTAAAGNDARIPTQDENDAMVGTQGTPNAGNKYVTDQDPRFTTLSNNITPRRCLARNTGTVAPATGGAVTVLALNTEDYDNDGMHDNATNNSRLTVVTAGVYRVMGLARWRDASGGAGASGAGLELCWFQVAGGTTTVIDSETTKDNTANMRFPVLLREVTAAVGDYFFLRFTSPNSGWGLSDPLRGIALEAQRVSP